jgi:hypothetical protein
MIAGVQVFTGGMRRRNTVLLQWSIFFSSFQFSYDLAGWRLAGSRVDVAKGPVFGFSCFLFQGPGRLGLTGA